MSSRWGQFETSWRAQIATETAFKTVQAVAAQGIANVGANGFPSVAISISDGKTIAKRAISGAIYVMKRIMVGATISSRKPSSLGESRLDDGGVWNLYDLYQAKALGFTPTVDDPSIVAVFPAYEEDFYLDRLEPGAVDLHVLYSVDVELQNPNLSLL